MLQTARKHSARARLRKSDRSTSGVADIPGARPAPMPPHIAPQLAVLAKAPPSGDGWLHEVKFDGYRILAHIRGDEVRLLSRRGKDWTDRFPAIAKTLKSIKVDSAILDGEVVVLDEKGASDFQALQNLLQNCATVRPIYFAFDLLYLDGIDLREVRLLERKHLLERILRRSRSGSNLRYSDHVTGDGNVILREACRMKLEGIISKRAESKYRSLRTTSWLKSKCGQRQEFVIIGFTDPEGSRIGFGALLLGYYDDGKLVYCGRVGTGFDDATLRSLHAQLRPMEQKNPPTDQPPPKRELRGAHWVAPKLVAEVRFAAWTRDGLLRQPAFIALRSDKPPTQVRRELPVEVSNPTNPSNPESSMKTDPTVAGVRLTNPDRVLYPELNLKKRDLARYYEQVAERILPHVVDRPLALVRCPKGRAEKCFFQKHLAESSPATLHEINVGEGSTREMNVYIHDLAGLIQFVQLGVLEIHTWGSHVKDIERPDQITFDLDPGPGVSWKSVIGAAVELRDLLEQVGLPSFVKTSGGKGLHVVIPLKPSATWEQVKSFTKILAEQMEAARPSLYTSNMSKAKRKGKIFIDYLRNGRGATAIAPYSTRAREGAPISLPLRWEELPRTSSASEFTVSNVPARLRRQKRDPWHDFDRRRVDLARAVEKILHS